jgi:hypothetical protein
MTKVIPREARRITYSSEIRKLKLVPLSAEQRSVINGSLLGDGCLHVTWGGKNGNYRFAKMHSVKQRRYVSWMYEKLKPFVLTQPRLYEPTQSLKLRTISHPDLTALRGEFYTENGKKVMPSNIADILKDKLALAVWFMDDGNAVIRNGRLVGYHLNTQSFTKLENMLLIKLFKELYDIDMRLEKNKKYFRLAIWQQSSRKKFRSIFQEHILPSMQYKLG